MTLQSALSAAVVAIGISSAASILTGQQALSPLKSNNFIVTFHFGNIGFDHRSGPSPDLGIAYGWGGMFEYSHRTSRNYLLGTGMELRRLDFNITTQNFYVRHDYWVGRFRLFALREIFNSSRWTLFSGLSFNHETGFRSRNSWWARNPFMYPYYLYPRPYRPRSYAFGGEHLDVELLLWTRLGRRFFVRSSVSVAVLQNCTYSVIERDLAARYVMYSGLSFAVGVTYAWSY